MNRNRGVIYVNREERAMENNVSQVDALMKGGGGGWFSDQRTSLKLKKVVSRKTLVEMRY